MKEVIGSVKRAVQQNRALQAVVVLSTLLVFAAAVATLMTDGRNNGLDETQREVTPVAYVTITAEGFEPATLSVKKGTRVIWTNEDEKMHQVAANPHPTRDELPELYSEILNQADSYEFTTDKNGTFGYHDQLNPLINGTLEVN